jgi:hypothetical protein
MAETAGDREFAATCRAVLRSGQQATESRLFNGRYYEQQIIPPGDFGTIAPRLRSATMGAERADQPEFQIHDGCLLDQLAGDTYARLAGLGAVLDAEHARAALAAIHQLNYRGDFGDWANCVRTYATAGERGHIVLCYPAGLPEHPMPYWSEVWTGLEYVYAIGLAQQGQQPLAEDVVAAVRERFSGARRNPFDEAECGHHYARALASWGLIVALTGFGYDGRTGQLTFARAERPTRWFWSNGYAWGTIGQSPGAAGELRAQLYVGGGAIRVDTVLIGGQEFRPAAGTTPAAGGAPGTGGTLAEGETYELEPASPMPS